MIVVAHAGHWLVQVLYAAPLIIMVVMLFVGRMRQRREIGPATPEQPSPSRDDDHCFM